MNLTQLSLKVPRYHKRAKRVGCGDSSGHGGTSTRGGKGQSARTGYHTKRYFEGGQMPLIRKTPKRGFNNKRFADTVIIINLRDLNKFNDGDSVNQARLFAKGIIQGEYDQLKVLGKGTLERSGLTVEAHCFSASAAKMIAAKNGKAVWLNPPRPPKPVPAPKPVPKAEAPKEKPAKTKKDKSDKAPADKAAGEKKPAKTKPVQAKPAEAATEPKKAQAPKAPPQENRDAPVIGEQGASPAPGTTPTDNSPK